MSATIDKTRPAVFPRRNWWMSEARQYFDADMEEPRLLSVGGGTASVISRRRPGRTSANQDSAAVIPCGDNACVLLVADGLGGGPSGDEASRLAVEAVTESVTGVTDSEAQLRTAILEGIEQANRAVSALGNGAATTLALAEISDGEVRPYHVGDSLVLVMGRRGRKKHVTTAHSPVGFGVEAGLLDEAEAMHHAQRHVVSNVVGMDTMHVEVGPALPLAPNDTVLLATDGLDDNLRVAEIVEIARKGPLADATLGLADAALSRMSEARDGEPSKPDDLTLILFRTSGR
jgi:serine/threonine protein phosphatase PrpC